MILRIHYNIKPIPDFTALPTKTLSSLTFLKDIPGSLMVVS